MIPDVRLNWSGANNDGDGAGKQGNPKDALGSKKLPLDLIPFPAMIHQALAHLVGACKYGKWNWRVAGVRSSIYTAACTRHIKRYEEGENFDPETGVHNLGHAIACLNIILDSNAAGKLTDDRPPSMGNIGVQQEEANHNTEAVLEHFKDSNPKHWTINDVEARDTPAEPDPQETSPAPAKKSYWESPARR